jgi:hypothetical protein
MPVIASRLIAALLLIAYTVTGIGPRGTALCLGGGHDWNEIIALRCELRGHHHGGDADHHHGHSVGAGCGHHQEHAPCTDIPLDANESRPSASQTSVKVNDFTASDVCSLPAWLSSEWRLLMMAKSPHRQGDSARTPLQVTATLRAVVLLL